MRFNTGLGIARPVVAIDSAYLLHQEKGFHLFSAADTTTERARSTYEWNRKATGSCDGVAPTLVYMAVA